MALSILSDSWTTLKRRVPAFLIISGCSVAIVVIIGVALSLAAQTDDRTVWLLIGAVAFLLIIGIAPTGLDAIPDWLPRTVSEASGNARFATKEDLEKYGLFGGDPSYDIYCGFAYGKPLFFPGQDHVTLFGKTRSGKDMRWLVENIRRLKRSLLIMDPKGEQAAMTVRRRIAMGSDVLVFNPFWNRKEDPPYLEGIGFNVLIAIDPDSNNFFSDCFGVVKTIVLIEGNDPHWNRRGQALLCAIIMGVKWDEKAGHIEIATMAHVKSRLSRPYKNSNGPSLYDDLIRMSKYDDSAAEIANNFLSGSDEPKEIEGVISSIWGQMSFLHDPTLIRDLSKHPNIRVGKELCAVLRKRGIDVRKGDLIPFSFEYLKHQLITVYVILPADKLKTHSLWFRLVVGNAIKALSGLPGDIKPVLMLNEAGNLKQLEALEDSMSILAGMGVTIATLFQGLWQVRKIYGDAGAFTGNAGFIGTLIANDDDTPPYFVKRAGTRTVMIPSYSKSSKEPKNETKNFAQSSYPLIHPDQITGMPRGKAIAWIGDCPHPINLDVPIYEDVPGPKVDPNPWYIPPKRKWLS